VSKHAKRGKRCNGGVDVSVVISICGHGSGRIVSVDGARVVLETVSAAPPGALLSCNVEGLPLAFKVKVSGCKRSAPETFCIEGRFVDLTREQRLALESMLQGSS
jgi:hypothetical protein